MKCEIHPKYQVKKRPKTKCRQCWKMFIVKTLKEFEFSSRDIPVLTEKLLDRKFGRGGDADV